MDKKLYTVAELGSGDFLSIPGTEILLEIDTVKDFPNGTWLITMKSGATLDIPSKDRKLWAVKKEDLNEKEH